MPFTQPPPPPHPHPTPHTLLTACGWLHLARLLSVICSFFLGRAFLSLPTYLSIHLSVHLLLVSIHLAVSPRAPQARAFSRRVRRSQKGQPVREARSRRGLGPRPSGRAWLVLPPPPPAAASATASFAPRCTGVERNAPRGCSRTCHADSRRKTVEHVSSMPWLGLLVQAEGAIMDSNAPSFERDSSMLSSCPITFITACPA